MSSPSAPEFTKVEMTGSPGAVSRLMEALSGVAEVHFDSRSDPDARGEVTCTAEMATVPGHETPLTGTVTFTVQAVLDIEPSRFANLSADQAGQQVAEDAAGLLRNVRGSSDVQARVVCARAARAPRP
ncbi:hypothetical protein [Streptomyces lydicus]|uniref:hypothetical protein n=1 Tax=Streptomyces lydicus TaxID=47763 RepID=UPI001012FF24|nr:hypothetical protein [Streptomyces lydicus]MCZ1012268.1 hypothetical protein [Streptomyces lydicus]